jgi:Temperature dependent protein affecting M2 dsRNA replication
MDCIYSDSDILLYEVDRVVLGIDFEAGTFSWIFKDDIREYKQPAFNAATFHEIFMDVCILAGGIYDCPVLPTLAGSLSSMGSVFTFERAIDLLRTYGHGITVIRELSPDLPDYTDRFARTKGCLTYMPVITDKNGVETLSKKNVPNNIAMLITPRLANEIYFYISRHLVGTNMYDLLISDHMKIHAPLDGGDSLEYRNLLNEMIPLRTTCLSLLASHSNRFLHHKHLVFPRMILC